MDNIKIEYVIVAEDINYVRVNDGDVKFSIVEPLVSVHIPGLPKIFGCRVAFTVTGMEYGEEYNPFFTVRDPDGTAVLKNEQKFVCDTHSADLVVTTFVQDIKIHMYSPGEYTFEVGIKNGPKQSYTLYVWQGEP